jgi:hypothetical protein
MGGLSNDEKELEKEREKLNRMMDEARKGRQPSGEAILEQSRKVDELLAKVQKVHIDQKGKTGKQRKNPER